MSARLLPKNEASREYSSKCLQSASDTVTRGGKVGLLAKTTENAGGRGTCAGAHESSRKGPSRNVFRRRRISVRARPGAPELNMQTGKLAQSFVAMRPSSWWRAAVSPQKFMRNARLIPTAACSHSIITSRLDSRWGEDYFGHIYP
jgi:hypothetical protein